MTIRPRPNHSPAFKAKVAVAAIKDAKTLIELAYRHPDGPWLPYLAAVADWDTHRRLAWQVSVTLDALEEVLARHGQSKIFNTDSHTIGASSRVVCLKHRSTIRWVGAAWLLGVI